MRELGITYRWHGEGVPPGEGDVLRSSGGTYYLIVEARELLLGSKFRFRCQVIEPSAAPSQAGVYDLAWDSRTLRSLTA